MNEVKDKLTIVDLAEQIRKEKGWSLSRMAKELDLPNMTYWRWANNKAQPTGPYKTILASFLAAQLD
jgi:transcriptional regulator with XRE-family HTH domain